MKTSSKKPAAPATRPHPRKAPGKASIAPAKSSLIALGRSVRAFPVVAATNPAAAVVTFTVGTFVALNATTLGQPKAVYTFDVVDSTGRVKLDTSVAPPVLRVNNFGGAVQFQIVIKAKSGPEQYVPVGISFDLVPVVPGTGAAPDSNFPSTMYIHNGSILTFTDSYLHYTDLYAFTLIIRRQSDRALGILDPCILHEN